MAVYLLWRRIGPDWIGTTTTGKEYRIRRSMRGTRKVIYLDRPAYGTEVCNTIGMAKEYANELARLAGFPQIGKCGFAAGRPDDIVEAHGLSFSSRFD